MTKTPAEYRAERQATVETPGGLVVTLRKFNPADVLLKFNLQPGLVAKIRAAEANGQKLADMSAELIAENYADLYALTCAYVCAAAVAPRITMEPTEDADAVYVRELDPEDIEALLDPILKWLGLSREVLAIAAPFRNTGDATGEGEAVGLSA